MPSFLKLMKIDNMWCTGGSKNAALSVLTGLRQREGLASEGAPCYYQPGLEAVALPASLVPCQTLSGTSKNTFPCFFLHWLSVCFWGKIKAILSHYVQNFTSLEME